MVKKIFCKENYDNNKRRKNPEKVGAGERVNYNSDRGVNSKNMNFTKNKSVSIIYFIIL